MQYIEYINITNFANKCKFCNATSTIQYIAETTFCENCLNTNLIYKKKSNYTPTFIGDYTKTTYKEFNQSLSILNNQLSQLKVKV